MTGAILDLILTNVGQVFSEQLNIYGCKQVRSSAMVHFKGVKTNKYRKLLDVWKVQEGYPPMQTLPHQILFHIGTYFFNKTLFKMGKNVSA